MDLVRSVGEGDDQAMLTKSDCVYTSCYCEENVFMLCSTLASKGVPLSDLIVVFISNPDRQVAIWRQQSSLLEEGLVVWDYHVICFQLSRLEEGREMQRSGGGGEEGVGGREALVWDLDSTLPFPVRAQRYFEEAFKSGQAHPRRAPFFPKARFFRLISAAQYLRYFASDRSHMFDKSRQKWQSPPPPYPCIQAEDGECNRLGAYIEMGPEAMHTGSLPSAYAIISEQRLGVVLDEDGLVSLLTRPLSSKVEVPRIY